MRFMVLLIFALATSTAALAQGQPIVRAEVSPDTVNVGESAELTITVLVPTWFTRPSVYPSFELANAITRSPADSSYNIRERVGNESWSGIVRSYEIYPLLGARYRLSGLSVEVTYATIGGDPRTAAIEIPEVAIRGRVPDGAEALDPYIAGRGLSLRLDVVGELDSLEAGDAVVLEYVAELDGLPAIFIPPLAPTLAFDGVSVYADVPDVEDGTPARRSEKLTLVFESGGEFSIPDVALEFWNTDSQSIARATAKGLRISVVGPVVTSDDGNGQTGERRQSVWIVAAVALGLAAIAIYSLGPALTRRLRERAERNRKSEPYAFAAVQSALRMNNATAYHAILSWLDRLEPGLNMQQLARDYGDATLSVLLDSLSRSIYADADIVVDLQGLGSELALARKRYLARYEAATAYKLPPLNP